jgi:serine/threonine protein kinase
MGEVFLGRSAGGWAVAVKVIRPDLAADPEFRVRFKREVAAARSVSGLYTAAVADADTSGPTPWLATAYVPGPSLARAVDLHGPLPTRSVFALAAGLAEGLTAIHRVGLVHRDLKPSNVLLAADGPRIIDFGIARDAEWTILTIAGQVVGSPDYMSPEQASGQEIGPRSDVFSLGGVLTFAASGQPPFRGVVTAALLTSIVQDEPDLRLVPPALRPLISSCLIKNPADRPTPAQLLVRLGEHAELSSGWLPADLLASVPGAADAPPTSQAPPPARPWFVPRPPGQPAEAAGQGTARQGAGADAASGDAEPSTDATQTVQVPTPPAGERRQRAAPASPAPPPVSSQGQRGDSELTPPSVQESAQASARHPFPVPGREPARPGRGSAGRGQRRGTGRPPRIRWRMVSAVLAVLAAAGLGSWLAIGGHLTGGTHSSGSVGGTAAPRPRPPYQLTVTGARELSCAAPAALHSMAGGHAIQVVFADHGRLPVRVIWLKFDGTHHPEVSLLPGATRRLQAYSGDAWELADAQGCIAAYDTTATSRITVTRTPVTPPSATASPHD